MENYLFSDHNAALEKGMKSLLKANSLHNRFPLESSWISCQGPLMVFFACFVDQRSEC